MAFPSQPTSLNLSAAAAPASACANLDKSTASNSQTNEDSVNLRNKQYWTASQTDSLLALIYEHRDSLRICRVQKQVWSMIAQKLNSLQSDGGAEFTGSHCSTKWRNLKRDLRLAIECGGGGVGRIGGRNPQLMTAVAELDAALAGTDFNSTDERGVTDRNVNDNNGSNSSNRRLSLTEFPNCHYHQQPAALPSTSYYQYEADNEGPFDLTVAKRPPTPTQPQPQPGHRERVSSFSSAGSFTLRRHRSIPSLPTQQQHHQPGLNANASDNSLAILCSILGGEADGGINGELGDLVAAAGIGAQSNSTVDPLGEARRRLQLMRRSEVHSHFNRIGQLDRLINVIDAAIEAGNRGGNVGATSGEGNG